MSEYDYELFVIGAGSGGVRAARMAAGLGIRVAIAEHKHLGGTCVNVGCVPKKLFVYAAQFHEQYQAAAGFGWSHENAQFNWSRLMAQINQELQRLQAVYQRLLDNSGVKVLHEKASLLDKHRVQVGTQTYCCRRILIATGGQPYIPDMVGKQYIQNSNAMFTLATLPRRMLIVGGGYIAVEFAGIMHALGVQTTLCYRGEMLLRGFDDDLRTFLLTEMRKKGIKVLLNTEITSIEQLQKGYLARDNHASEHAVDLVLYATGRVPNTAGLGLQAIGVELNTGGAIRVNEQYQTSIPSIYALGDVTDRVNLTPVAIAEAKALVNALYTDHARAVDYDNIPSAVFSQPNIGTVGLSEAEARARFDDIDIYKSEFTPMKNTLSGLEEKTLMKMVVRRSNDKVLGVHMVGAEAGEIIQGMAVAIRAGATKATFDTTLGIHPTAAEEFVTLRDPIS